MQFFTALLLLLLISGCASKPDIQPVVARVTSTVEQPNSDSPKLPVAEVPYATKPTIPDGPVDVWLMPVDGFPEPYARDLATRFSGELGLNVRATVSAGVSPNMFGPSKQMIAEKVVSELIVPIRRLYDVTPKTAFIILVGKDLNGADGGTRFVFAEHFQGERLSVVSLARMEEEFFQKQSRPELTMLRLYKMVKKTIGLQYFGYQRSTDINSVMYSPVMSLDDLDSVGTAF